MYTGRFVFTRSVEGICVIASHVHEMNSDHRYTVYALHCMWLHHRSEKDIYSATSQVSNSRTLLLASFPGSHAREREH